MALPSHAAPKSRSFFQRSAVSRIDPDTVRCSSGKKGRPIFAVGSSISFFVIIIPLMTYCVALSALHARLFATHLVIKTLGEKSSNGLCPSERPPMLFAFEVGHLRSHGLAADSGLEVVGYAVAQVIE